MRKSLGLIDILIIWIVVMVSWIFTHIRINQTFRMYNYRMSITLEKKLLLKECEIFGHYVMKSAKN